MYETSFLKRTHIVYLGLALNYYSMPFPFHTSHIKHARPQLVYKPVTLPYETKHAFAQRLVSCSSVNHSDTIYYEIDAHFKAIP